MKYIKIIFINFCVFITILIFVEVSSGIARLALGKKLYIPHILNSKTDINDKRHPCNEQKTDVLLDHISNHRGKCLIKGGKALGEYVVYDTSISNKPILLTLGGSTTAGFYQNISNGETWPKILAEQLAQTYQVVNGGVGGYSSQQELLKFYRDGPRFKDLAVVVSLNGINEEYNYHGDDNIRSLAYPFLTNIQMIMNNEQVWVDQRISYRYFEVFIPNFTSFLRYFAKKNDEKLLSSAEDLRLFRRISAPERWEMNMKRLKALVEIQGAKFFVFLQPTLGLKGIQSDIPVGSADEKIFKHANKVQPYYFKEINKLYSELIVRCKNLDFCIDITNSAPPSGDMYNDARHHNAKGNEVLATEIIRHIKQ